jgi:hypothetical protein
MAQSLWWPPMAAAMEGRRDGGDQLAWVDSCYYLPTYFWPSFPPYYSFQYNCFEGEI